MAKISNLSRVDKDYEKINITRHDLLANIYRNIITITPTVVNQRLTVMLNIVKFTYQCSPKTKFKSLCKVKTFRKKNTGIPT